MVDTVQSRLKYWRVEIKGLSLRELQGRVNGRLPPDQALSLGTVSNYERPPEPETAARPGPRTEFLVALKRAFPDLRIEWLLFGDGEPTELAQRLATPDGLEAAVGPAAAREPGGGALARRVLERCPDLELLSPEASALFMGALTRYAVGEPNMALAEDELLDLAEDLAWLLFLPVTLWGFDRTPSYDDLSDYAVAMLHALMQLMPARGKGDPIEEHAASAVPRLRRAHPSGFAA